MCRHLYNWSLKERIEAYETDKRTVSYCEQANKLPALKKERAWFKDVYSQVLQNVLKRLDLAFQNFFRRVKNHGLKNGEAKTVVAFFILIFVHYNYRQNYEYVFHETLDYD